MTTCAVVDCPAEGVTPFILGGGTYTPRVFEVCRPHMLELNHGPVPEVTDDGRLRLRSLARTSSVLV